MNRYWACPRAWEDGVLVCKQVQPVTNDVKTFLFEPAEPRVFRHDPGQHLTVTLEIDGREVDRCYTISSPPSRPLVAAITVKRVPGGVASNWLHDHLAPGHALRARGPLGTFSPVRHPAGKYLFLSGGSGITPVMSMTRTLHDLAQPTDVVFVHSARTPADIIFRQELDFIAATSQHIRVVHVCETDGPGERWLGHRGRLDLEMLHRIAPDFLDREVFTCGPPAYMAAVRDMLTGAGLPEERYHEESFDLPSQSTVDTGVKYTVELARSGVTIECDSGTSLLEAASSSGITLPSSCGQGMCGTCKTTLLRGSVDLRHNGGIRPREVAADKILLCCAKPRENLVLDC
ncbi:hybrid-cluster NAD(P)-dependent oxidoreductase [Amycolatopsis sp. CA-230715]|uniref:hybrid-cluster NAD(P)-dependent oxidoreductase n=1 Tax=Amycolatopsis sp. CA-230715 TaxID=2745196 RepID=UPI001C022E91|nr:hybrid-cluster NAD(P)-dependent oxidoreductase [Amycolatopsis sp. CA-230715]QWF78944.1 NADPH oxidoreductase [Amycolatopsis sp. CA-230715]